MPKKRKSRGRAKGGKGRGQMVQCSACGGLVPRDKAKKVTRWISFVEPTLARELRAQGAYIPGQRATKYYCVSCAVSMRIVRVRSQEERRTPRRLF